MSVSHSDFHPTMLAAQAAKAMGLAHRIAYAQLAPDLTITQASFNFATILEAEEADIIGQPVADLLWEFVGAEEALTAVLRGEAPIFSLEQVNRGQTEDTPIYLNFQVTPLDDAQPGRGLLLLVEDATEYGRLHQTLVQDRNELRLLQDKLTNANQELQQLNRLKSIFLSMSAHDLRTPLSSISGYTSLVLDQMSEPTDPHVIKFLRIVLSQSDRMNRLISDFLDLDRIEQGKLTIQPEPCHLNDIIQEVITVMQINADSRQINMTTDLPIEPILLWADRDKLFRIVYNLVSNAIKYTQREGRVQILAHPNNDEITLQVIDNGYGMTEIQLSNLFQLYYRTEEAEQSKIKGTGLGLYIVKMLVEAHQGRVAVASQHGHGSTFTIILPQQPTLDV